MDRALYERIGQWVNQNRGRLIDDICRLVRIPSISDEDSDIPPYGAACKKVIDEMLTIAGEHGFCTENYEYHCCSMWLEQEDQSPDVGIAGAIGLWGHLDVVPAGNDWIYSPFDPVEKDGYLIGRGTGDNKGPAVADLYAVECLRALNVPLRHPLRVFSGCNEERGMRDILYFTEHYPAPLLSLVTDGRFPAGIAEKGILEVRLVGNTPLSGAVAALNGGLVSNMVPDTAQITLKRTEKIVAAIEAGRIPADLTVTKASAGEDEKKDADEIVIQARGIARHSASPAGGVNAISVLARGLLYADILEETDEEALLFFTRVNLGAAGRGLGIECADEISGALTCVGSICSLDEQRRPVLSVNIRYPVQTDSAWLLQKIEAACEQNGFHPEDVHDNKPNYFPKDHPAVDTLVRVYNEITEDQAEAFTMGGGTYARKLPRALVSGMGIPPVGADKRPSAHPFLPAGHGGAHAPDEALKIDNLLLGIKILCMELIAVDQIEKEY